MKTSWEDAPKKDRLTHVGKLVARTPKVVKALEALKATMERHRTRAEGSALSLTGDTRSGKTTILREFLYDMVDAEGLTLVKTFDPAHSEVIGKTAVTYLERRVPGEDLERPVLCIQVSNRATYTSLLRDVITAVTEKKPAVKADHGELVLELCTQIVGQKTRMIIFDDVNNIAEHKGREALHSASEVFKMLMKVARVQVGLVGMDSSKALLRSNKQLDEMVPRRHQLTPYAAPDPENRNSEFLGFIQDLKSGLPFDRKCPIDTPACLLRLHILTEGRPGAVSLFLSDAVEYALENDLPFIDINVFAQVLKEHREIPDRNNIFLAKDADLPNQRQRARSAAIQPPKTSA